ncbi:hypothetical protein [Absidia glauca]|uniref:C2H2-type domain-containing protein n=1 Tax=Absidia glauca TaxID=4829 RepID=A0A168LLB9_ABSGL|nr:hypothetical protein [Absidia glauca]
MHDFKETTDDDDYDPNDYLNDYGDDDEEHDDMTSENASTSCPPTPRSMSFKSPPQAALSLEHDPAFHGPFESSGVETCHMGHPETIADFSLPTPASAIAIAIATAINSPEAASTPTKIKIMHTPTGLKRFLQGDILGILGHKKRSLCPECGESLSRPQDLKRHMLTKHTDEFRHPCSFFGCTKRFVRSDVMNRHLRNVHRQF